MSLTTAQQAAVVEYYELVKILVGDNYYITNAPFNITFDGDTYTAFGMLLGFDAVEENSTLDIASLNISISGIAPNAQGNSALTDFVDQEYVNSTVEIWRQYYEAGVAQGQVQIYKGFVTGADLIQSEDNSSNVLVKTASHWSDFDQIKNRRTNDNSQQRLYPGDLGMEYSREVQKEITWKA